ncbi:hypothetical protein CMI47_18640 [Candidatus Pacearchaeota archaeon]|nr:hypothetical protein [Candidatus Pacearchaeota archaeon]|tara:strand:+ start:15017 stop:15262 length:246 start_codon:yes stop_codon:yes gene_type:complete
MALDPITIGSLAIPVWIITLITIWDLIWRILAVMKSTRYNQPIWSVVFVLFSTIGILPILYIYVFAKDKRNSKEKPVKKKK